MSQNWHAHWAEDSFKPTRLQNWEIPRWHNEWPDRHCMTTKVEAHTNGHLFASVKRVGSPWGDFKGTWELPLKIDRRTAEELSKATEYKKNFWKAHRAKHERACKNNSKESMKSDKSKKDEAQKEKEKKKQNEEINKEAENLDKQVVVSRRNCNLKKVCVL